MIEFFLPNSRAFLPTFSTFCPDGSQFAQMGSRFAQIPQNTTTNPCSLLSRHKPLSGICTIPPQNSPFPGLKLKLESGQRGHAWQLLGVCNGLKCFALVRVACPTRIGLYYINTCTPDSTILHWRLEPARRL